MIEQKLKALIIEKCGSVKEFSSVAGLPYTTLISILKRGVENANVLNVIKLCNVLNLDVDALAAGNLETKKNNLKVAISPAESETIKKYRALDEHGKDMVDTVLAKEYARCTALPDMDSTADNCIWLPLSEQAASAGTGVYLGPEAFEQIQVLDNEETRRADFAVRIQGDSMQPLFHNGDIVLVSKEEPQSGEIALVTLDGCGYVKRLGDGVLISENKRYDPIPMDESIIVNGCVLGVLEPEWILEQE